jgi:hypothetical protein
MLRKILHLKCKCETSTLSSIIITRTVKNVSSCLKKYCYILQKKIKLHSMLFISQFLF